MCVEALLYEIRSHIYLDLHAWQYVGSVVHDHDNLTISQDGTHLLLDKVECDGMARAWMGISA